MKRLPQSVRTTQFATRQISRTRTTQRPISTVTKSCTYISAIPKYPLWFTLSRMHLNDDFFYIMASVCRSYIVDEQVCVSKINIHNSEETLNQ